jgi:protease secretion system outer membrane protein
MHSIFKFLILAYGVFASMVAWPLDLMSAYELALINDPIYKSASKDYEAGVQNEAIGRSAMLPKLFANYNKSANKATQWGQQYPGGPSNSFNWNYPSDYSALQITQPIINLDAVARWKQGISQVDFSRAKFMYGAQDLLMRVLQGYTDFLFSLDQLKYQRAERDAFFEQSKVTRRLYEKGEGSVTDALESQAAYQVSEAKLIDAIDAVELARRKLEVIVGLDVLDASSVAPLKPVFSYLKMNTKSFNDWKSGSLSANVELKAMEEQVSIAYQEYKKNEAAHYPIVNLVAATTSQNSNTVSSINQTTNQNYVGIQVNLPIYAGGETAARASQAYANYEKSKADFEVARDRVITELRKQYDLVQSSNLKIQSLSKAQESSNLLVQAMRKSVVSGEKINLDVLLAQKNLFLTSRDLSQGKYSYLLAYLKLHQLSGRLEVENFQEIAKYFAK